MRYWLKRIREEKNMSQDLVSREAGIAQGYYSDIENGVKGCKLPVETAKKIAAVLDFEWTKFYEDQAG